MRAVTFRDIGVVAVDDVPPPTLEEADDVILRVTTSAICGSDLHVLNGRIPGMSEGGVLGHEFVGVVEQCGADVTSVVEGDRALASFTIPCGHCWFCARASFNRCPDQRVFGYGAFLGDLNGGQAEFVRVPAANLCLRAVPGQLTDEQVLFAGDIFTTGVDAAMLADIHEGDVVAVQGCGPVGLMVLQALKAYRPAAVYAIDTVAERLAVAAGFGAIPVDAQGVHVPTFMQDVTDGRGADVVIECVGAIPAFTAAIDMVRAGGRIAVIGVYSEPEYELPINLVFVKGIDLRFGGTANIIGRWDHAMQMITDGTASPSDIITHRLSLNDAVHGYELFEAREALKVILTP